MEPNDSALSSTLSLSEAFNINLPLTVPESVKCILSSADTKPLLVILPIFDRLREVSIN